MTYQVKPLSCDPTRIKGMSERLIISHYENNYGGAVKRLNLIDDQLAQLEFDKAAGFLINGLKREQLIAMNSMILHELFFDGLGDQSEPSAALREAIAQDFESFERWRAEFIAMGKALGGGSGWVLSATAAGAQEIDWQKVDNAFGRKAAIVSGDVHRYSFPRTDLIESRWRHD